MKIHTPAIGYAFSVLMTVTLSASEIIEPKSAEGLQFQNEGNATVLSWPSDPRETFAVLWRSKATLESPWLVLDGQVPAASGTNSTMYRDNRAATAVQHPELYKVLVVPDFWFDMREAVMSGGPRNPGEDFVPFYYGTTETGFFKPTTELLVDGQPHGVGTTVDEDVQRVNFGTVAKPQWAYAAGFWFHHDEVGAGEHTLQFQSTFLLNNFVGQWTWTVTLTNKPVKVRVVSSPRTQEAKGGEKLLGNPQPHASPSWWGIRLGKFARKRPTAQDTERHFVYGDLPPHPNEIKPRPFGAQQLTQTRR